MPIYLYACPVCDNSIERIELHGRYAVPKCLECMTPMVKLPTAPAIQFKGSGWAKDGYSKSE